MASVTVAGARSSWCSSSSWARQIGYGKNRTQRRNRGKVVCSSAWTDPYKTLRIRRAASESEVKKAFRQLALQYHPDVCRGGNCRVQFQSINEAYDLVMSQFRRGHPEPEAFEPYDAGVEEGFRGMNDPDWEMWEEWMGWEGAGIRDFSSHINPYT